MSRLSAAGINLATQPLRRERAQNALWAGACAGLLLLLVALSVFILHARAQAADLRRGIERQRAELARLTRESSGFSAVLAKPANADVFARNVFLNEVIARRAVSWTLVFRDLEHLLPANVRLIGVRLPQVAGETAAASSGTNHVELDMIVGTDRPEAVIELLTRLDRSSLFGSARLLGETPPNQNDPLYKFRVQVPYAQKL